MFTLIKNTKVYEQVIEQIKLMIENGSLQRGDKLPSERDLVEQLGVSRSSIREALRVLEIIGLIECRQGEGNFIKQSFENGLFEPLSVMFMLNHGTLQDIFELRRVIEVETAVLAAERITEEELMQLQSFIEQMDNAQSEDERVKIDKKFHYTIAYASRNFLIVNILNTVASLMKFFIKNAREQILKNDNDINTINNQHKEIYTALLEHNPDEAARVMRKHMDLISGNVKLVNIVNMVNTDKQS